MKSQLQVSKSQVSVIQQRIARNPEIFSGKKHPIENSKSQVVLNNIFCPIYTFEKVHFLPPGFRLVTSLELPLIPFFTQYFVFSLGIFRCISGLGYILHVYTDIFVHIWSLTVFVNFYHEMFHSSSVPFALVTFPTYCVFVRFLGGLFQCIFPFFHMPDFARFLHAFCTVAVSNPCFWIMS